MTMLKDSPLELHDILVYFPDFDEIGPYKQQICDSLIQHQTSIAKVQENIQKYKEISQELTKQKLELRKRYVSVTKKEKCSQCLQNLINGGEFVVYPCRHCFHWDCILTIVQDLLPTRQMEQLNTFKNNLDLAKKDNNTELIYELKQEIEDMATLECCFCGDLMIRNVDTPFFAPNENILTVVDL